MLSKILLTAMCALMLQGCASSNLQSEAPQLQASLRQPCPQLQPPGDGTGETMLRWSVDLARMYRECRDRHARTVEAFPK